jgi:hypothetical protein
MRGEGGVVCFGLRPVMSNLFRDPAALCCIFNIELRGPGYGAT